MSHANGEIWSLDGHRLGFFEYNGTADVACSRVYTTHKEMHAPGNWRNDSWRSCSCQSAGQPVILYSEYGGGFHWDGRVCWNCSAIIEGLCCEEERIGHPFFDQQMLAEFGRIIPCPKCGGKLQSSSRLGCQINCSDCGKEWWSFYLIQQAEAADAEK